jgi:hypothetical protein
VGELLTPDDASAWINIGAILVAVLTVLLGWLAAKEQRDDDDKVRRWNAKVAVEQAKKVVQPIDRDANEDDWEQLVTSCVELSGYKEEKKAEKEAVVKARVKFLRSRLKEDGAAYWLGDGAGDVVAARFVALVADFAPEWLLDCETERRMPIRELPPCDRAGGASG